jgi:DNA-binding response OmpR family regulator
LLRQGSLAFLRKSNLMTETRQKTVLVVDDHADIRALVSEYLQSENFTVLAASNGDEALGILSRDSVDMMILDLNMPGCDGFEVCRQVRKDSALPILVLSARAEDLDKILLLELGADDYLTKPFNPRELMARVRSTFRRMNWDKAEPPTQDQRIERGILSLDVSTRQAWVAGQVLALTPIEFSLLACLAQNRGQNMTRQQLLNKVWGEDYFGDERTVDAHIRSVRAKLKKAEQSLKPIVSVWGVGYRFEG